MCLSKRCSKVSRAQLVVLTILLTHTHTHTHAYTETHTHTHTSRSQLELPAGPVNSSDIIRCKWSMEHLGVGECLVHIHTVTDDDPQNDPHNDPLHHDSSCFRDAWSPGVAPPPLLSFSTFSRFFLRRFLSSLLSVSVYSLSSSLICGSPSLDRKSVV